MIHRQWLDVLAKREKGPSITCGTARGWSTAIKIEYIAKSSVACQASRTDTPKLLRPVVGKTADVIKAKNVISMSVAKSSIQSVPHGGACSRNSGPVSITTFRSAKFNHMLDLSLLFSGSGERHTERHNLSLMPCDVPVPKNVTCTTSRLDDYSFEIPSMVLLQACKPPGPYILMNQQR